MRLMLDVCCGPCSTHVIDILKADFELILFFQNSNIYPKEEYDKRLTEAKKIALRHNIKMIVHEYDHDDWLRFIKENIEEPEKLKEGGRRCNFCFRYRLEKTVMVAIENGADYFTTTLTISPHKDSDMINEIGKDLENKYGIRYLESDFKKQDGFNKSIEKSKKHGLYRQDYCGCEFSMRKS